MKSYNWLNLSQVKQWEPLAKRLNVSEVARSSSGFLSAYKKAKTSKELSEYWINKRNGFIARHMAQMKNENLFDSKGNPSRRHLALIMWAYSPKPNLLRKNNPTVKLYRAAGDEWINGPSSFVRHIEDAEAYLNNPPFGGNKLYSVTIDLDVNKVLDLYDISTMEAMETLIQIVGYDPGSVGPEVWIMDELVADKLREAGISWVRVRDSFPEDCETWTWVGEDSSEIEDGMKEIKTNPMNNFVFVTNCVSCGSGELIREMVGESKAISRRKFLSIVDRKSLDLVEKNLGYEKNKSKGLTMASDRHVGYFSSRFDGVPVVFFRWSAIEYIFADPEQWARWKRKKNPTKKSPTDKMIKAYGHGKLAAKMGLTEYIYSDRPDYNESPVAEVFFDAGYYGTDMPKYTRGWRLGEAPECGRSYNYRDQRYEVGVSMMEVDDDDGREWDPSSFLMCNSDRPRVELEGWLVTHRRGSDGEPLLVVPRIYKSNSGGTTVRMPNPLKAFEGFDFFENQSSYKPTDSLSQFEINTKEPPEYFPAERYIKIAQSIGVDSIRYFKRNGLWAIRIPDTDMDSAIKIGKRIQSNMVGKRSMTSSDPYFFDMPMHVFYNDRDHGIVFQPKEKAASNKSLSDRKYTITNRGKGYFGNKGFEISGRDGDYKVTFAPYRKEHRGVFSRTTVSVKTLDEAEGKLEEAISKLSGRIKDNPLLAIPPTQIHSLQGSGGQYFSRIVGRPVREDDYYGVHTSDDYNLASAYAQNTADKDGSYPVVVEICVDGLTELPDVDAVVTAIENADRNIYEGMEDVYDAAEDFESNPIEDTRYRIDNVFLFHQMLIENSLPGAFVKVFDEPQEEWQKWLQGGDLPLIVGSYICHQRRYNSDIGIDRVVSINANKRLWEKIMEAHYGDEEYDQEVDGLNKQGYQVVDLEDVYNINIERHNIYTNDKLSNFCSRKEFHGTSSHLLSQSLPEIRLPQDPYPIIEQEDVDE